MPPFRGFGAMWKVQSERESEREREEMGRAGVVVQEFWLSLVWSEKASGSVTSHAGGQPADPN